MNDVAQKLNEFFVNIGPELADKIPNVDKTGNDLSQNIKTNPHSMFLRAVDEVEIVSIVQKFQNKSTDCDRVDMVVVKKVIDEIAKPLSHICNLSFQTEIFPSKMKTVKIIPLYKVSACFYSASICKNFRKTI